MDKQEKIINMFDNIAATYDTTNRVMSMGVDITWRKEACKEAFKILQKSHIDIADIACGTGDMMLQWEASTRENGVEIASIVGIDPSNGMLDVARKKIAKGIFFVAQASKLPLKSESKDIISIAYGLRNVVDRKAALSEFYRVLKPGGVVVILEFMSGGTRGGGLFSALMRFYTKCILPLVGGAISRNFKAYKYLPNSIDNFVSRESLEAELALHNMPTIFAKDYSAGVCSLVIAKKD
ncbi:bifunctional demethylmenaquinone methyltransferase/2-methoxy-6-polyprenyl-1,4-benzoquinol methylase UbiE [Helicobacter saguini]|uniref:Demethylmenaquinone methyltransferase n=1 Tax=Helicobacter saguini TaxID=1548018 RepID=A0A347W315_9HELI|nr:bifunctional demethylmenaquinone methyltransferase/2-methoxy-6-polyprenyl-1,4-benzoquinol methylase UbiE [Helicobacter saguini]MWV62420.1 bifunctional demethylmenaquinone methyltransferase/2-methoxy-6-polyprenyl-1,4-benzoquinol methylase UbiE [Helicobacter saguini]MWV66908.1 bifunctional demethylmenaquinone methyltransferase/2-methoxy-6-polyprenyl-1,4-benzoquinol methylase UbiE [Helicobacter saguini]MWV69257.1 bifunctional demethylmenaquinone methyltransferase/2-methoxy-6-polyprenyl-1,4-benzo